MPNVLITGASRGIGAACAVEFARRGWGVALHYHKSERAAEGLAAWIRGQGLPAVAVQGDVAEEGDVLSCTALALRELGALDALVCNAGIDHDGLISQITGPEWRRLFGVNVDGVHYCCRAILPHFLERQSGSIVTVSSMWGQVGASCEAAYSATKGAVIAYTKALAKELGPSGIRVNCVAPGVIETDMNARLSREDLDALAEETPLGCIGAPEEVAKAVYFLASGEASFITGQVLGVNGGFVL